MSLGLRDNRRRQKRQVWWRLFKIVLGIGLFLAVGGYAYLAGENLAHHEVERQAVKIAQLEESLAGLQQNNGDLSEKVKKLFNVAEEWKARYEKDIPTGEMDAFLKKIEAKLEGGLDPARLAFVIDQARPPENCDAEPVTKRFIVRTPLQGEGNDAVSFFQNAVTVTATGDNSVDENGNNEAWFDKAKPLSVSFAQLGGETAEVQGVIPLHYAVIAGNNEYRFSVTEGPRGFVLVTADRCDYP